MSRYAMEWAKQQATSSLGAKLVLIFLADDASGREHGSTQYVDCLAKTCGMPESTVVTQIKALAKGALIKVDWSDSRTYPWLPARTVATCRLLIPATWRTQGCAPSKGATKFEEDATAVYRLFNVDGEMIYVGISNQPDVRLQQHALTKPWWDEVATREVEWYSTRPAAEGEENRELTMNKPRYNDRDGAGQPGSTYLENARKPTRYVVKNSRFAKLLNLLEVVDRDIYAGVFHEELVPDVAELADRYGVDTNLVVRALDHFVKKGTLEYLDGKYRCDLNFWG